MILENDFKNIFNKSVEKKVSDRNYSYIDAVIQSCEEHSIEVTVAAKWLSSPIKEKLMVEGQEINLIPKTKNKLPL